MIISTVQELDQLLPPNVSTRTERLFALFEQTERSLLIPVLGQSLYDEVTRSYRLITAGGEKDADGQLLAGPDELYCTTRSYTPMQQLIRLLHVPLVYLTLSNNASLLSVSLNDSGLNMVSAEGYDSVRREDREAFARDCYMNAHKGMEQVLLFLEHDAQLAKPVFLSMWMQSTGFYMHSSLLLRTATEFSRYSPINDSRETYLQLVPSIRNIQDLRLRPELGDLLMNALIQFSAFGPQSAPPAGPLPPSPQPMPHEAVPAGVDDSEDTFFYDLRPYLPCSRSASVLPEHIDKLRSWTKALSMLRHTLACYVEHDSKRLRRGDESLNDAMSSLHRLRTYLTAHSAHFAGVIEQSPFITSVATPPSVESPCASPDAPSFLHDPFCTFYN